MPFEYDEFTKILLMDTEWHRITNVKGYSYCIKNRSGVPLKVAFGVSVTTLFDTDVQYLIGGLTYELRTDPDKYLYVQATAFPLEFSIRPDNTIDPSEDLTYVTQSVNSAHSRINNHLSDKDNPHEVTKTQIGLSEIPNAIPDSINDNIGVQLATSRAVYTVNQLLFEHKYRVDNPHEVSKSQVGLSEVENYPPADDLECLDTDLNNLYMTPYTTGRLIKKLTQVSFGTPVNCIIKGKTVMRETGWTPFDCDVPSGIIEKTSNLTIKVHKDLLVSYSYDSKNILTYPLQNDINIIFPSTNGDYYIYVDIDENHYIENANFTNKEPIFGQVRESTNSDFYSIPYGTMFDHTDKQIRRVYIGRVIVYGGIITTTIPVPIGVKYTMPILDTLYLSGRFVYLNPFIGPVKVQAEVYYLNSWGPTEWNDQIGTIANIHPVYPTDSFVVQVGQMGFLSSGRESGAPFHNNYLTVTSPIRTRVVITRNY